MTVIGYKLSIIVPFLNERDNLPTLVDELNRYIPTLEGARVEVVFVDDGSSDGSVDVLKALSFDHFSARVVKLSRNYGSHSALRAGLQEARGEYITFLYADLQDPLAVIGSLLHQAQCGYDIVWAVRQKVSSGVRERAFSRLYARLMHYCVTPLYPAEGFDVALLNRDVQSVLNRAVEANSSIFLQMLMSGFRQYSITYDKHARKCGQSKWTVSKKMKLLIDSLVAFSYVPIRLVSTAGLLLAFAGLVWIFYALVHAIFLRDLKSGWPALISILLLGFGITNISLGVIAEYLWRTLDAARNRPAFIVERVISLKERENQ